MWPRTVALAPPALTRAHSLAPQIGQRCQRLLPFYSAPPPADARRPRGHAAHQVGCLVGEPASQLSFSDPRSIKQGHAYALPHHLRAVLQHLLLRVLVRGTKSTSSPSSEGFQSQALNLIH